MFQGWTYDDYIAQFEKDKSVRFIEPMSAHEIDIRKYLPEKHEFAELKYDGHRSLAYIGDKVRVFSRRISKKSGWYSENTDQVPHIRDVETGNNFGTVLDGEFDYGNTSMGVQSVLGSKPERAIKFQEENGYIPFKAFDIIYYRGINVQKMPLWKRKCYLAKAVKEIGSEYVQFATMYMTSQSAILFAKFIKPYLEDVEVEDFIAEHVEIVTSYKELYDKVISEEQEGIMLKSIHGKYEQKRSKSYLKVKGQSTWDCVVMGYTDSTKVYEGKEISKWKFWEIDGELREFSGQAGAVEYADRIGETAIPVTKPYFNGWCGGISFGVWREVTHTKLIEEFGAIGFETMLDNREIEFVRDDVCEAYYRELVHVGDCKGLTEKIMKDIKYNGLDYIGKVVEVRANGIIDKEKGSLRHPRFEKWRWDKESNTCTWEDHNRSL